jgi:hypothetical protein
LAGHMQFPGGGFALLVVSGSAWMSEYQVMARLGVWC